MIKNLEVKLDKFIIFYLHDLKESFQVTLERIHVSKQTRSHSEVGHNTKDQSKKEKEVKVSKDKNIVEIDLKEKEQMYIIKRILEV